MSILRVSDFTIVTTSLFIILWTILSVVFTWLASLRLTALLLSRRYARSHVKVVKMESLFARKRLGGGKRGGCGIW